MRTGIRLTQIAQMITQPYRQIWDCCCDHGLLGFNILKNSPDSKVHFVDIVPSLTDHVSAVLQQQFNTEQYHNRWQVHCLDVAKIPLGNIDNQLVIVAGVGGDLLIDLVTGIVERNPTLNFELLLCPVHHNVKVRQALTALNFGLIDEKIVCENKRYYEVIHVATNNPHPISNVGSKMWDTNDISHRQYLQKTLSHYQRMQNSSVAKLKLEADNILKAYAHISAMFK